LTTPLIITPPTPREKLLLYIFATNNVASTVLVIEREEEGQAYPIQRPVYYMIEVLADANTCYSQPQELLYALLIMSRKLRQYFRAHKITMPSSFPLEEIICNRDANGRIVKWSVELGSSTSNSALDKRSSCRSSLISCQNGRKSKCPLPRSGLNTG
jgi:hypothetical protein